MATVTVQVPACPQCGATDPDTRQRVRRGTYRCTATVETPAPSLFDTTAPVCGAEWDAL